MDKSLSMSGRRMNWDITTPANARPSTSSQMRMSGAGMPAVVEEAPPTDLFALFDFTQDLTEHLGSHLETYESIGSGMWSWSEEQESARVGCAMGTHGSGSRILDPTHGYPNSGYPNGYPNKNRSYF